MRGLDWAGHGRPPLPVRVARLLERLRIQANFLLGARDSHVSTDDPMMAGMAGRYAAALFELAKDQRQIEAVEADIKTFQGLLDSSEDLRRLVRSPVVPAEDQLRAMTALLGKTGVSPLTVNFIKLIT